MDFACLPCRSFRMRTQKNLWRKLTPSSWRWPWALTPSSRLLSFPPALAMGFCLLTSPSTTFCRYKNCFWQDTGKEKFVFAPGDQGLFLLFLWDPWCGAEVPQLYPELLFQVISTPGVWCSCSVQCLILQKLQYLNFKMFVRVRELETEL